MAYSIKLLFITCVLQSDAVSFRRQLEHVAQAQAESDGHNFANRRNFYQYDPREVSQIIGVPARVSHLPRAENILPGHTLIRPGLGMLKSAVKFPHKDLEDGTGVYGHYENLGETYGRNERVLNTGFRRSPSNDIMEKKERAKRKIQKILQGQNLPSKGRVEVIYNDEDEHNLNDNGKVKKELSYYITNDEKLYNPSKMYINQVLPSEKNKQPSFNLRSVVLDLEKKERAKRKIQKILQWLNMPSKGRVEVIYNDEDGDDLNDNGKVKKELSYYITNDEKLYNPSKMYINQVLSADHHNRLKPTLRSNKEVENNENYLEYNDSELSESGDNSSTISKAAFWATKDLYDHVKLPHDAIDILDLIPEWKPNMKQVRQWWFFNQEDYKPLKEE